MRTELNGTRKAKTAHVDSLSPSQLVALPVIQNNVRAHLSHVKLKLSQLSQHVSVKLLPRTVTSRFLFYTVTHIFDDQNVQKLTCISHIKMSPNFPAVFKLLPLITGCCEKA